MLSIIKRLFFGKSFETITKNINQSIDDLDYLAESVKEGAANFRSAAESLRSSAEECDADAEELDAEWARCQRVRRRLADLIE